MAPPLGQIANIEPPFARAFVHSPLNAATPRTSSTVILFSHLNTTPPRPYSTLLYTTYPLIPPTTPSSIHTWSTGPSLPLALVREALNALEPIVKELRALSFLLLPPSRTFLYRRHGHYP